VGDGEGDTAGPVGDVWLVLGCSLVEGGG
jgi:hypothetical protein